MYISDSVNYIRLPQYEVSGSEECAFIWVQSKLKIISYIFVFFLYRSPNFCDEATLVKLDELTKVIDEIYTLCPSAEIVIAGDFNVHNTNWLSHSGVTTKAGVYTESFADINLFSQLVDVPTRIPDNQTHNPHYWTYFLYRIQTSILFQ